MCNRTEKKVINNKIEQLANELINTVDNNKDHSVYDSESFSDVLCKNNFNAGFKKVGPRLSAAAQASTNARSSKKGFR